MPANGRWGLNSVFKGLITYEALNIAKNVFGKYTIYEFNVSTFVNLCKA
jgi:hypothetical protein